MSMASPNVRALAVRLIAVEEARADPRFAPAGAAVRVCEKLRQPLSRFAGVAGFRSLLSRALAMAKAEVPSLGAMQVQADGSFAGLDGERQDQNVVLAGEGGIAVVAHLLDLLVTFIGESLTLRLVRDAWPDKPVDETDPEVRGEP
jgi:hypothetical protein